LVRIPSKLFPCLRGYLGTDCECEHLPGYDALGESDFLHLGFFPVSEEPAMIATIFVHFPETPGQTFAPFVQSIMCGDFWKVLQRQNLIGSNLVGNLGRHV
jgi:hypothetical protein